MVPGEQEPEFYRGRREALEALLECGADPNAEFEHTRSILELAIERNKDPRVLEILLKHGMDPNKRYGVGFDREEYKKIPLFAAAHLGKLEFVKLLLKYGAKRGQTNYVGQFILHVAVLQETPGNIEVVKYLLATGSNKKTTTNGGETAYDIARRKGFKTMMKLVAP